MAGAAAPGVGPHAKSMTEVDDRQYQDPERKRRQRVTALSRRDRDGGSGSPGVGPRRE